MNNEKYFKDLFESITDYRKIVLLFSYFKMIGIYYARLVLVNVIFICSYLEFKNSLTEQHEEYLDYAKNKEENTVEKFLNK